MAARGDALALGSVFAHLDYREKNGYERHRTRLYLEHREESVSLLDLMSK